MYRMMKGMSEKMNFYGNESKIYDLDNNIPVVFKSEGYQKRTQGGLQHQLSNQNKVYFDKSRILGNEAPNQLKLGLSRVDVMKWKMIRDQIDSIEDYRDAITLSDLNLRFSGSSLFHEFASQPRVLEMFH